MTNKKMPELAKPWVALYGDGGLWGRWATRSDAERGREHAARNNADFGPFTVARIAVVEVVEPEPEPKAAPSGWVYEVAVKGAVVEVRLLHLNKVYGYPLNKWRDQVPPIDHDHVAALIDEAKCSSD